MPGVIPDAVGCVGYCRACTSRKMSHSSPPATTPTWPWGCAVVREHLHAAGDRVRVGLPRDRVQAHRLWPRDPGPQHLQALTNGGTCAHHAPAGPQSTDPTVLVTRTYVWALITGDLRQASPTRSPAISSSATTCPSQYMCGSPRRDWPSPTRSWTVSVSCCRWRGGPGSPKTGRR